MKQISILLFIFLYLNTSLTAQKRKENTSQKSIDLYLLGKKLNDNQISKIACFEIIAIEGNQSSYKDSLTSIYFEEQNYTASLLLSDELLNVNSSSSIIALKAYSLKGLNRKVEAKEQFQKLVEMKKDKHYVFEIAFLEYELGYYNDALSTIDYGNALFDSNLKKVDFTFANEKYVIEISKAFHLLKILVFIAQNNIEKAHKEIDVFSFTESENRIRDKVEATLESLKH